MVNIDNKCSIQYNTLNMKTIIQKKQVTFFIIALFCFGNVLIKAQVSIDYKKLPEIQVEINTYEVSSPIHPYTYGMFTELLANIFDHGLWAEMISDRKFFYPIDTFSVYRPENTRRFHDKWKPVTGSDIVSLGKKASIAGRPDFVEMDTKDAFVGKHSPKIKLGQANYVGIQQDGLMVKSNNSYTGYIYLAGKNARVSVTLIWGNERLTKTIIVDKETFHKVDLLYEVGKVGGSATLQIVGEGDGYFKVGAVSLMPANNVKGFRKDLVDLLKQLNSGIYRWPGGNMLAGYEWRDGIGDRDKRSPKYDYAWNALEDNDVGSHEFMDLCELLGIDPYFVVNIGFGDAFSAAQWVEYMNGDKKTEMGRLRAKNGHPEPYNVKWWGVGNEMYGQWQLGHMSIDHYILKHNYFVEAMKKVDPTIKIIGCGANPFETSTTARHNKYPLPYKLPYAYGSDGDWSGKLLEQTPHTMDYLAEHLYPFTDHAFNADSQKFIPVDDPIVDQARRIPNRIKAIADSWEIYEERIPDIKKYNIAFAVDEWTGGGRSRPFLRTLCAAEGIHEIFRHSDIITMGGYTAVTSCVRYNDTASCYSAVGLLFKLYREHLGTLPVAVIGNIPQKPVKGTVGVDKPEVSSGSETYPLDIFAAKSKDGKKLTVTVVNPTEVQQSFEYSIIGMKPAREIKKNTIKAADLDTGNKPGEEPKIIIESSSVKQKGNKLQVKPLSITLYQFSNE